jgi:hypothetical protein
MNRGSRRLVSPERPGVYCPRSVPPAYGRHVNRVVDVKPDDLRKTAFSGGGFHDF